MHLAFDDEDRFRERHATSLFVGAVTLLVTSVLCALYAQAVGQLSTAFQAAIR